MYERKTAIRTFMESVISVIKELLFGVDEDGI